MKVQAKQIIGFEFSVSETKSFSAFNPNLNEEIEPKFFNASLEEINMAVEKADVAFKIYRKISQEKRANFLLKIAENLLLNEHVLVPKCMEETALTEARLKGELMRTVNQIKMFAEVLQEGSWVNARIDTAIPDRTPPKPDLRFMNIPLGAVAIFGASNFPFAFSVAGGDSISALASGCPIVVKANPAHPATSELVGQIINISAKDTNMPEGVFSLLQSTDIQVGQELVKHPKIKAVGFTGSFKAGKAIFDTANSRPEPIPVFAEMGSSNPVFILPEAMKNRGNEISENLNASVNLGVGQFCTNPGVVIAENSEFTQNFLEKSKEYFSKNDTGKMLTKGIKNSYEKNINEIIEKSDINILSQGKSSDNEFDASSYIMQAEAKTLIENPDYADEIFGPSTIVFSADFKSEILKVAENLSGHLTATIHATENDLKEYSELIDILENKVGRLIINGFPTGVEVCHSMQHGGPFPATTNSQFTSVGATAIMRFVRPISYQDFPQFALPEELKNENPLSIFRTINGVLSKDKI